MPSSSNSLIVFFAWQSEILKQANRHSIEASLRAAASRVERSFAERDLTIHIDKDTKDRAGTVAVADTILEKIEASDVFLGDVTITNGQYAPPNRLSPNANLLLELGFAVGVLGWDRVISVFNNECGHPITSLPFDLRHRRVSPFSLTDEACKKEKSQTNAPLTEILVDALTQILEKNPAKASEFRGMTEEEIKKRRDVETLTWLLHYVHWPSLDEYIQEGPKFRSYAVVDLFESYAAVLNSSYFHLYDKDLYAKVSELRSAWELALTGDVNYEPGSGRRYVFTRPPNRSMTKRELSDMQAISAALGGLRPAMDGLLQEIRTRYASIDTTALSEDARNRYVTQQREFEKDT
jgi:hypothetical protein